MARTLRPAGMLHVLMVCARALVQVRGQRARRRCPRPRPRARARARPLRRPPRRPHAARTPPTRLAVDATFAAAVARAATADFRAAAVLGAALAAALAAVSTVRSAAADTACGLPRETREDRCVRGAAGSNAGGSAAAERPLLATQWPSARRPRPSSGPASRRLHRCNARGEPISSRATFGLVACVL
jgi:hypothetical protein